VSHSNDQRWTLEELAARVALALAENYEGQSSGRVTEVPNPRTLRYYTTLGLLDRPAEMRGRTAYYSARHLAQIVAIKRLQAHGLALSEVQAKLHGLGDAALQRLAKVPPAAIRDELYLPEPAAEAAPEKKSEPTPEPRRSFWRDRPAEVPAQTEAAPESFTPAAAPLQGVPLGPVTLLLAPARPLEEHDLEALRAAAAPLLKLLETRGLLRPQNKEKP
jgi:DNA-binding transcriptional MerR regulator